MKIKIIIFLFILSFFNHIGSIELINFSDIPDYEKEIHIIKKYLTEKDKDNDYTLHMLNLCIKYRGNKSILYYAIKDCLTGNKYILKILLNSGAEIPKDIKTYITEFLGVIWYEDLGPRLGENRYMYIGTNATLLPNSIKELYKTIEESENEKKLVVQQTTILPNVLITLIFQYLNCIKWKNFNEVDQTQFQS